MTTLVCKRCGDQILHENADGEDLCEACNTRPAAPVEGLETVGYVTTSPTGAEGFQRKPLVPGHGQFGYKQDAVVTRSQAEELLAAERAETMRQVKHWSKLYKQQHYRAEKAEAIIAAKDKKIADLENELNSFRSNILNQGSKDVC